jgi:hypothetical protein
MGMAAGPLTQGRKDKLGAQRGQHLQRHARVEKAQLRPHGVQGHRLHALHEVRDVLVGKALALGRHVAPDGPLVALLLHAGDEAFAQPVHELGQLQHMPGKI